MIQTPIQKLEFPNDRGVRLYCKREDLLPFSLGGNKVRIGRAFFPGYAGEKQRLHDHLRKQQIQPLPRAGQSVLCRENSMLYDLFF